MTVFDGKAGAVGVEFSSPYSVVVPESLPADSERVKTLASGIYLQPAGRSIELHYMGKAAREGAAIFKIPRDADVLRELAEAFVRLADRE